MSDRASIEVAATTPDPSPSAEADAPMVSARFRTYALWVLLAVYTVNFLDRQIVSIVAEPIKNELRISDTQLGLLSGLAFGVIYCGFGLPLARLADKANRVWIISGSLAVWSACTILCGRATNFAGLVAARMGVGLGEAGCTPTAHALISDYTPREKRASALAFFSTGTPLGSLLGMALGGVIADAYGWRHAFLMAGLPGLLLAVLVFFTLREPRKERPRPVVPSAAGTTFGDTIRYLSAKPAFWLVSFGGAVKAFVGYGQAPFVASFFLRAHGEEVAHYAGQLGLKPIGFLGIVIGLLAGVFGTISTWLGGAIADQLGARDLRAYGSVPAVAAVLQIPFFCAAMSVDNLGLAFLLMVPSGLLSSLWYGPVYASAQSLVPPQMRATSASIMLFVINMTGLGLGALTVGALSDTFNHVLGMGSANGMRWALIVSSLFGLVGAGLFLGARRTIRQEVAS